MVSDSGGLGSCPKCGKQDYSEHDCGPDSWDDDIAWTSYRCKGCSLWYDGWSGKWYEDIEAWQDVDEYAKPYQVEVKERKGRQSKSK